MFIIKNTSTDQNMICIKSYDVAQNLIAILEYNNRDGITSLLNRYFNEKELREIEIELLQFDIVQSQNKELI